MAEHNKNSCYASKALQEKVSNSANASRDTRLTSAQAESWRAFLEESLSANVGFHLVVSAYWDSMPTVADIVIVSETSGDDNSRECGAKSLP